MFIYRLCFFNNVISSSHYIVLNDGEYLIAMSVLGIGHDLILGTVPSFALWEIQEKRQLE
jgi:hypothetical protein